MIYFKSFTTLNHEDYDETWMIVRSWKEPDPHMRHVPELSPSLELLHQFITWRDGGEWNYEKFVIEYIPRFLCEFRGNAAVTQPLLDELVEKDKAGKMICLACFCEDETICHRSIIAGFLQERGAAVRTESGKDYRSLIHFGDATG
ncbi:MAG: DUF488 domain-containing protein [Lachnospiraceae bacterium]|nr:DUF488 domain-containing protein [Lachnospiraceae bacterium]